MQKFRCIAFQVHVLSVLKRSAGLRSHRKTSIWLSGDLVKDFLNYFLLLQTNFLLLHIITNCFTTTVCNLSRGVLTKHIRGGSTFSKTCSYRAANSLKRVYNKKLWKQFTLQRKLFYVPKNFTNWQENTRDIVSFILTLQGRRPQILLKETLSNMFSHKFEEVFQKIFPQSTSQATISLVANTD